MPVEMFGGNGMELNGGVQVFGVFTEHHDVDVRILGQRSADAGQLLGGTHVDVEVELLAHLEDGGFEALDAGLGGDGGHQGSVGLFDGLDGFGRNGVAAGIAFTELLDGAFPHAPTQVGADPVDGQVQGFQNQQSAFHHVETGVVAGHVANFVAVFLFSNLQNVFTCHVNVSS